MEEIHIGSSAEMTKTFTQEQVAEFARLTGDDNPIHLDPAYAKGTMFQRPIVHGMFSSALISAILGTRLPGPGSIYLSQTLEFKAPVYMGDTLTARCEVIEINAEKRLYTFRTTCTNQEGKLVVDGRALIKRGKPSAVA